jgi:hypothetical protein
MPTLRLVYLTEQQYADMTDHAHDGAANNTTAEEQLPSILQEQTRLPIADATRNTSSNKQSDHEEEDNDYHLDTLLQEATYEVNRRSFGGHAVRHQQVQQEEMVLSSDEESENDSSSSERVRVLVDAVQQFQHEMVSSDEESENDSTPSPEQVDAVQQKSGNKRKIPAPKKSFDGRFNDLMSFKAKYSHCYVPQRGENASLGRWRSEMRSSYKKIQNNQKPKMKLSDGQIQRLDDAGFKWPRPLQGKFDKHFNDLMSFKAKYGHCDVPQTGENVSLGKWCGTVRSSYTKIKNNQMPSTKLSDEQIQRLNDAGFKWSLQRKV